MLATNTKPETADHKSVHDLVSAMEMPLCALDEQINVLQYLIEPFQLAGADEHQQAVAYMVTEIASSRAKARAIWEDLWEASKPYNQRVQS